MSFSIKSVLTMATVTVAAMFALNQLKVRVNAVSQLVDGTNAVGFFGEL